MLVSQNSRLDLRVLKLDSLESRVFFRFSLVTQRSLALHCVTRQQRLRRRLEKRESGFEDLAETVNLRYRRYRQGHSGELIIIKTRFRYPGSRVLFTKYNDIKKKPKVQKKGCFLAFLKVYVKQTYPVLSTLVLPVTHTSSRFFVHLVYFVSITFCN